MNDEHYRKAVGFAYVRNQAFKYGEPLVFFDADEATYAFYSFDYQVIPRIVPDSLHPQKWKTLCWEPGIDDAMYLTAYQRLWSREILDAN